MAENNKVKETKKNSHYLSGKEIREITKQNRAITRELEKKKHRKADESEFISQMKDDSNILEIEDLHTYFFTDQGIVKAVNGVSFNVPKNSTVGIVGESGCGKSVTSMSVMQLVAGPQGQIVSGAMRFNSQDFKRDKKGNPIAHPSGSAFRRMQVLLAVLSGLQSLCQLIGAGGLLHAAGNALDASDDVIHVHAFDQSGDTLQVAVAAADELNVLDLVVLNLKEDALGANTGSLVFVLHNIYFLSVYGPILTSGSDLQILRPRAGPDPPGSGASDGPVHRRKQRSRHTAGRSRP